MRFLTISTGWWFKIGTTAQKLQYLINAKANIDAALTAKGVTPPAAFGDYGNAIANIPSGGSNKLAQVADKTVTEITVDDLAGATSIPKEFFQNCTNLRSANLPNSVTQIGESAFYGCTAMTNITLPTGITMITAGLLGYCQRLETISIPNGVTSIGQRAFYKCDTLNSIDAPSSISSIAKQAFYNSAGLQSITIRATTPPTLENSDAFGGSYPIYVPSESVEAYKAAPNWAIIQSRIFAIQNNWPTRTTRICVVRAFLAFELYLYPLDLS